MIRRGFLQGLATLPLIGGGVTLLGKPTAAAVPVTTDLAQAYKTWLYYEHRMLCYELGGHTMSGLKSEAGCYWVDNPAGRWHGCMGWDSGPQPSSRAAVVLSTVGCCLTDEQDDRVRLGFLA